MVVLDFLLPLPLDNSRALTVTSACMPEDDIILKRFLLCLYTQYAYCLHNTDFCRTNALGQAALSSLQLCVKSYMSTLSLTLPRMLKSVARVHAIFVFVKLCGRALGVFIS